MQAVGTAQARLEQHCGRGGCFAPIGGSLILGNDASARGACGDGGQAGPGAL